jgi:plasmid stabilization system protein ParE
MEYLVRLSDRALRDLSDIYDFTETHASAEALAWFRKLEEAIYSLERFPDRGSAWRGNKKRRQLLFGKKPNTYKIIYEVDRRTSVVKVFHIRHSARAPF